MKASKQRNYRLLRATKLLIPLAILLLPSTVVASLPQQSGNLLLGSQANLTLSATSPGDEFGTSFDASCDLNGDGTGDIAVGAPQADYNSRTNSGAVYIAFGPVSSGLDLSSLSGGFRVEGAIAEERAGRKVLCIGDINGDNLDDLMIGAPGSSSTTNGIAYVIYGRTATSTIDLDSLSTGDGFILAVGEQPNDRFGHELATVGDVNDDGYNDYLIGAFQANQGGVGDSGSAYVIFGGSSFDGTTVALATLATDGNGFEIYGVGAGDNLSSSPAGPGDVNGDGISDLLISARFTDPNGSNSGSAWVVFGSSSLTSNLAASSIVSGNKGFVVNGSAIAQYLGSAVSDAGDVNQDGKEDILIGVPLADNNSRNDSGSAYLIYGRSDSATLSIGTIGTGSGQSETNGLRFDGQAANDQTGSSVANVGDLNSDGYTDYGIGANGADPGGVSSAGSAYVVYGSPELHSFDLTSLTDGTLGYRLDGQLANGIAGRTVGSGSDLNGDGRSDLLIGAPCNSTCTEVASLYGVYGFGSAEIAYTSSNLQLTAGAAMEPVKPTIARTGPATVTVSPALPTGLVLDSDTGEISGTPLNPQSASSYTLTTSDLSGTATTVLSIEIATSVDTTNSPPASLTPPTSGATTPAVDPLSVTLKPNKTLRLKALKIKVTTGSRPALVSLQAKIKVGKKTFKLRAVTKQLAANSSRTFKLKPKGRNKRHLLRYLKSGRRLKGTFSLVAVATDGLSSETVKKKSSRRIKRR